MVGTEQLREIAEQEMGDGGLFVYDLGEMTRTAHSLQAAEMPYGMEVRYAVKANSHPEIISRFDKLGLSFDASSLGEARRLLHSVEANNKISLSSRKLKDSPRLRDALAWGVVPVATSRRQVSMIGKIGQEEGFDTMSVRINPGWGSGGNNRTTVGGPASPFGIWKDYVPEVRELAAENGMTIDRLHTHIGSGVKPDVWRRTIQNSLDIVEQLPDVTKLDIGGGYKIARMPDEEPTDMDDVLGIFAEELEAFAGKTGREIYLEIEPGTLLVGNAGVALMEVEEVESTPLYNQLTTSMGMNALMRISHYGALHPIEVLNESEEQVSYAVYGPCCESGDLLTPERDNPEKIVPRLMNKAEVGDLVVVRGVGAYCMSMSPLQYNLTDPPRETVVGLDQQG
jgi:diaminopimelate decarboxylase